ncbi:MAG: peptidoglycan editing factor PgeF [Thermoleophilia bacterium]
MGSLAEGGRVVAELRRRADPTALARLHPVEAAGLPLLLAAAPGLRVVFTTRVGGMSAPPYASLNLSARQGDDQAHVAENRRRLLAALADLPGGGPTELVSPRQEHGLRVCGATEYARAGGDSPCDGLVVNSRIDAGRGALLLFADCVPVVLVGEVDGVLVHGGWRGLLGGIVQQGARSMTAPPGAALVGPSIGPCCYRVGDDLAREFTDRYGPGVVTGERDGPHLDLWEVVTRALAEVEVPRERVTNPRLCTSCHPDLFFSHRAGGPVTGRNGAVLWAVADPPQTRSHP